MSGKATRRNRRKLVRRAREFAATRFRFYRREAFDRWALDHDGKQPENMDCLKALYPDGPMPRVSFESPFMRMLPKSEVWT